MPAAYLHQTIAVSGAFEFLRKLETTPATALIEDEVVSMMAGAGVEDPGSTLADFLAAGLLHRYGDRVGMTTFGIRSVLLLEALNGGDVREVYQRLGNYDSTLRMYELVREGMTNQFLESITNRPGFARLYFCSPWIALDERQRAMLTHAVLQAEKSGSHPELFLITRPAPGEESGAPRTVQVLRDLGGSIFLNSRLHTKLYIREPDRSGGYAMAIVGSQNLTRSQYLELGIRINADGIMVNQLIAYFWELANASVEA